MAGTPGVTNVTNQTDVSIGPIGKPVRVFDVVMLSTLTASTVILRNGTTTNDTTELKLDGTVNKATTWTSANGLLFPAGCFADVDANTTNLTVSWTSEA